MYILCKMTDWDDLEKEVNQAIKRLDDLIPEKTYLYLPLISAVFFWGIQRIRDWRDRIHEQKIWPVPAVIMEKPDEFVLDFFRRRPALAAEFESELKARDIHRLRNYFNKLYPVIGLEDPFLNALFENELASRDYRRLIAEYEKRIRSAREDIQALEKHPGFMQALENIYQHAASLASTALTESEVQKSLVQIIENHVEKQNQ